MLSFENTPDEESVVTLRTSESIESATTNTLRKTSADTGKMRADGSFESIYSSHRTSQTAWMDTSPSLDDAEELSSAFSEGTGAAAFLLPALAFALPLGDAAPFLG